MTLPRVNVEDLLSKGLDHYAWNEVKEAIQCWKNVLRIDPANQQAKDYLLSAGVDFEQSGVFNVVKFKSDKDKGPLDRNTKPTENAVVAEIQAEIVASINQEQYADVAAGIKVLEELPNRAGTADAIDLITQALQRVLKKKCLGRHFHLSMSKGKTELKDHEKLVIARWTSATPIMDLAQSMDIGAAYAYTAILSLMKKKIITSNDSQTTTEVKNPSMFDRLFAEAVEAYFNREYRIALDTYLKCQAINPDDQRVHHNIVTLKKRLGLAD